MNIYAGLLSWTAFIICFTVEVAETNINVTFSARPSLITQRTAKATLPRALSKSLLRTLTDRLATSVKPAALIPLSWHERYFTRQAADGCKLCFAVVTSRNAKRLTSSAAGRIPLACSAVRMSPPK